MDIITDLRERQEKDIAKNTDLYVMLLEAHSKEYDADKAATLERIKRRQSEIEQEELKSLDDRHAVKVYSDEMKNLLEDLKKNSRMS